MGALQSQLALGFRKKTSPTWLYYGCFRKIGGVFHPKSSILKGAFHDFHHPFWGVSSFFWKHPLSKLYINWVPENLFFQNLSQTTNLWQCTLRPFGLINRKLPKILELWFFPTCYGNCRSKYCKNPTRDSRFLVGVFLNLPSANRSDLRVTGVSSQRLRLIKQRDGKEINENQSMNYEI